VTELAELKCIKLETISSQMLITITLYIDDVKLYSNVTTKSAQTTVDTPVHP